MVTSITEALREIKADLARHLSPEALRQACVDAGHEWRERVLDPVTTIHLFLMQVMHGNTACSHLPHLVGQSFTASAYTKARSRLPEEVLTNLVGQVSKSLTGSTAEAGRWHGQRTFFVDGSSFSMSDTPALQGYFGQPGGQAKGCGFPVARWLALFHAESGVLAEMHVSPLRTHEMSQVTEVHPALAENDVLVGDRGFCSYAHWALVSQRKAHALFRVHQRQLVDFRPHRPHAGPGGNEGIAGQPRSRWLKRWGVDDQLVEWFKPLQRPDWMTAEQFAALPEKLVVRELRYSIRTQGFRTKEVVLVTTLLDAERYPAEDLARLYRQRWQVETNFRHLKTTMKMDVLRCQTVAGVTKELIVFILAYNLVRAVMLEAARRQEVNVTRLSFVDALRWLTTARPGSSLPPLLVNPLRSGRVEPRVRKRRPKKYPLMKKPRAELRKALLQQADEA